MGTPLEPLTPREQEVLRQVAAGKRNKEIAAALRVEEHTVEAHLKSIFRKLRVQTRTAAAHWYWQSQSSSRDPS